ncbi:IS30 family transposase [Arsenicicoccus dermatophilus]|uniref:IS30 family transposase n=1 Tax=Arsenicicoccus dermatophilus TaxID=1076331 RepID=UPI001F4D1F09|nr:IS30 family transposase [Arsenicicoccus dermatophilus]
MGARRVLSIGDRVEIATGLKAGWSIRAIAAGIGRAPSVVSREVRRNRTKTRGYQVVHADVKAERRRARPQARKVALDPVLAARVDADLRRSRTPRQIAGRLTLEATDSTVAPMNGSLPADGRTCSHEAIYQYIYALPKGDLAAKGILLRSRRTRRRARPEPGQRRPVIVGMVPLSERSPEADDRRVPGHWEGDLIIGKNGATAAATLVERTTRYTIIKALPAGKDSTALADILIDHVNELPAMMRKSLTWSLFHLGF